jgi:hypothetical protein
MQMPRFFVVNNFGGNTRQGLDVEHRMPFKKASLVFHHLLMRNDRALCTYPAHSLQGRKAR